MLIKDAGRLTTFTDIMTLPVIKKTDTVPYSLVLNNGMILGFGKISGYNLFSIVGRYKWS